MGRFLDRFVAPYYLKVMGTNAIRAEPALLQSVYASGRHVTLTEVDRLLRDDWRPRVMGAWYAIVLDSRAQREALSASLVSSAGSLTAPPLALAATVVLGPAALPALEGYAERAATDSYLGSDGFVAACIGHMGGHPRLEVTAEDERVLQQMLAVAGSLQTR